MILSMTGFGEAQIEEDGHAYHVELRSVNNRYFKASIRLPDEFAFIESEIEQHLRKRITRGSVTLRLYTRDLSEAAAQEINVAAIRHYLVQLRAVAPGDPAVTIDLATLANLPGVCQPHELSDAQREHAHQLVLRLIDAAIERMLAMRAVEGKALAADLQSHCRIVRENLEAIRVRGGVVVDEYRRRLMQRVQQLVSESNVKLAEEDLVKEVAVYAERSDISEEISRLLSHLDQFAAAIESREPAGRKLDFISQEMLREANTIGSKAGDAAIARHTIEIKGAIDRIKEQVQNVE
ncbi:MAG: YicC family protein [Planctomycetes bacterium]|nr:YicC family protein [Planctomycetota bacterium]